MGYWTFNHYSAELDEPEAYDRWSAAFDQWRRDAAVDKAAQERWLVENRGRVLARHASGVLAVFAGVLGLLYAAGYLFYLYLDSTLAPVWWTFAAATLLSSLLTAGGVRLYRSARTGQPAVRQQPELPFVDNHWYWVEPYPTRYTYYRELTTAEKAAGSAAAAQAIARQTGRK